VGNQFYVTISGLTTLYVIQSATAQIQGLPPVTLAATNQLAPAWAGLVDATTLPSGTYQVVVTITDDKGNQGTLTKTIVIDRAPILTVTSPQANGLIISNPATLTATCTDDYGCMSLTATINGAIVASGSTSVSTSVDLSGYPGAQTIQWTVLDTVGQQTLLNMPVNVDLTSTVPLQMVTSVPGTIMDVDSTRVLYLDSSKTKLYIRNLGTQMDTLIYTLPSSQYSYGFSKLTTAGAVWQDFSSSLATCDAVSYEQGNLVDLGCLNGWQVNGNDVLWVGASSPGAVTDSFFERNVTTGVTTQIAVPTSSYGAPFSIYGTALAGNGVFAFDGVFGYTRGAGPGTPYIYKNGVTTLLAATGQALYIMTDGSSVLFAMPKSLYFSDGVNPPITITSAAPSQPTFQIANGWVSYTEVDAGVNQVWRRTAQGQATQLTFLSGGSTIEAMDTTGALTVNAGNGHRYYFAPNSTTQVDVGSNVGTAVFAGGHLYIYSSGMLVQIGV